MPLSPSAVPGPFSIDTMNPLLWRAQSLPVPYDAELQAAVVLQITDGARDKRGHTLTDTHTHDLHTHAKPDSASWYLSGLQTNISICQHHVRFDLTLI